MLPLCYATTWLCHLLVVPKARALNAEEREKYGLHNGRQVVQL